ncbi:uncharacterized protein LOC135475973 [Liolophura sinensis]|uniref:uncharacterized protein LOC135475973 n=1 Tax=Liolophura sinensis TaxID=3198878 RepID=UPI0031588B15
MYMREKSVLDRSMGTSLKAINRECAQLKKKHSQLQEQKSNSNLLLENAVAKRMAGSRSNLSAASSIRQIRAQAFIKPEEEASGRVSNITTPTPHALPPKRIQSERPASKSGQSDIKEDKPGPSARPESPVKKTTFKGKGKVTTVQDQPPRQASVKDTGERKGEEHQPAEQSHRRSLTPADLIKHGVIPSHRGSIRRESISGQMFSREEMEEQQRILDLFIHLVEKVDDYVFDPAELSAKIKEMAIERKQHGAAPISRASNSQRHAALPHLQKLHEDPALMKELQSLLHQRRQSVDLARRSSVSKTGSSGTLHHHNAKRRVSGLEMLSDILGAYKSQYKEVTFDPLAMLNCGYLRLSKSNVRELERLCREQGIDPGIHAHTDVEDFQLFDDHEDSEGELREAAV